MPMLYADDYVSPRRGFRDPLRMTQSAHVCSEFRSSGKTKTFKPFKPLPRISSSFPSKHTLKHSRTYSTHRILSHLYPILAYRNASPRRLRLPVRRYIVLPEVV